MRHVGVSVSEMGSWREGAGVRMTGRTAKGGDEGGIVKASPAKASPELVKASKL